MSFSQHLVLWLHVAFVIFTIGPATLAIMSTPRYIRQRDIRILRYLSRMTMVFAIGSLGVLIAGFALASMLGKAGKPWVIISATLFLVAVVLLILISRDQRHAIRALEAATATAAASAGAGSTQVAAAVTEHSEGAPALPADAAPGQQEPAQQEPAQAGPARETTGPSEPAQQAATGADSIPAHLASVERGRIAMLGGVVSLIWLVILVLMVWNS
jgi:hypothetical protein